MISSIEKYCFKAFFYCVTTAVLFLGFNVTAFAQINPLKSELLKITSASDSLSKKNPPEKLYLQFDKPYYAIGDTIWFKAYLLNGYLTASDKSSIINIDIANDSNKVIKQYRFPVAAAIGWGNISLDNKDFAPGTYTIRAYTNWMRNFDDGYFFYKSFSVTGFGENNWLVNKQEKELTVNGVNTADVKLQFSDMDKKPLIVEPLRLKVMNGSKNLYKQQVRTDIGGSIDVNFAIPQKVSGLAMVAENEQKDKKALIPVVLNRPENTDIQFLPEGGNLVAGFPAHIGFKAIGEDGKGVNISGIVTGQDQKQVAEFKSLHNGIGSFVLPVMDDEKYTAKVTLPDGTVKDYPLPGIKTSGTVLQVKNAMQGDSVTVTILATNDIIQSGRSYFLTGKARGVICYAAVVNFHGVNYSKVKIAKSLFPSGITHFTLMTEKYQPINERLIFIDHQDNLNIKLITDKTIYNKRDSVGLKLKVTDKEGRPVSGNFSMAVTDDAQVKTDSLNSENMVSRLLLTSDLKGYIETPGYYLQSQNSETWQALDNLLLTQGWVGYNWQEVFNPPAITYQPEREFGVKGSVVNVFNKPVKGTDVLLFSKSPSILMDTATDQNGRFVFNHFPKVDTPIFVLKAVNKNGKSFNVRITVDEVRPPEFIKPVTPLTMPWYVNSDSTLLTYAKTSALIKQEENFPKGGHILKEVRINAKKIVPGSQNLNGPGEADLVLDEKDLEAAGKKTWLQLLEEKAKGFREGYFTFGKSPNGIRNSFLSAYVTDSVLSSEWYFIDGKPVKLIVDGISFVTLFHASNPPHDDRFNNMRSYLESHSAEDIKGVEIMSTAGYAAQYLSRFDPGDLITQALLYNPPINISASDITFVEITTRGGHGPVIDNTPGMFLYKPLPVSWPKQFYKPKYTVKDTASNIADLRSTIDWEPNIVTNARGEAKLSFYAAGKPATYTVIIEGSDMNGNLGFKTGKIVVGENKASKTPAPISGK
jgi:hypothetical protein